MKNRIKKLSAISFNGSFAHDLKPVTIFAGKNQSGKTTRLNAVAFGWTGCVPGIAPKPSDVHAEFATGPTLSVAIQTEAGSINRTLALKRESVKRSEAFVGYTEDFAVPRMLFDVREFTELSEKERTKMIFKVASSSADRARVSATIIANLKGLKLEGDAHTPEVELALSDLVAEVQNSLESAAREDKPINDLVEEICADVRNKKLLADQNAKRMASTNAGVAQVAGEEEAPPDPDAEQRLASARAAHREKFGRLSELQTELRALEAQVADAEKAEREVSGEQGLRARLADVESRRATYASALAGPEPAAPVAELNRLADDARQKQSGLDAANLLACRSKGNVDDTKSELAAIRSMTVCKECGADVTAKRLMLEEKAKARLAEHEREFARLEAGVKVAEEEFKLAKEAKLAEQTRHEARQSYVAAHNALRNKAREAADAAAAITRQLEGLAAKSAEAAKLPELRKRREVRAADVELHRKENDLAFEDCTKWEGQLRRLQALRAQAAQRAQIEEEAKLHAASAEVLKLAVAMLDDLRATLVKESVGPLLDRVNALCAPVLEASVAYRDGSIGFVKPNGGLIEKTMCGAERALVGAAIQVTLAVGSPFKLLVVDELGRLDAAKKKKFVEVVCGLVRSGQLEQAIMADVDPSPYAFGAGDAEFGLEDLAIVQLDAKQ